MVNFIQVKLRIIALQRALRTAEEVRREASTDVTQAKWVPATKHPSQ